MREKYFFFVHWSISIWSVYRVPVFIVTSKVPSEVVRDMQRSTVDEAYALIEGDLENIVNNELLPGKMADGDLGRAD